MPVTKEVSVIVSNEEQDIGTSDVQYHKTFHRSELHIDVTPYDLSDQRVIILARSTRTHKKTMQEFFHINVLLLERRYRMPW